MKNRMGKLPHVFITSDTERGIMLEKARHPGLECIVQMPGRRIENDFFYGMVADSGINATYEYAMCEKDHEYCDHLSTRILEYYDFPAEELVVAQVHYHPAPYQKFSHGDGPANIKLARQYGGVTNGLMWVDPEFRMQFWYIDEDGNETPIDYTVDDEAVAKALPKKSLSKLKKLIEDNEAGVIVRSRRSYDKKSNTSDKAEKKSIFTMITDFCGKGSNGKENVDLNYSNEDTRSDACDTCVGYVTDVTQDVFEPEEDFESLRESLSPYTVLIPEEYRTSRYEGSLYGYYIKETKTFNVVPENYTVTRSDTKVIGDAKKYMVYQNKINTSEPYIQLIWTEDEPIIVVSEDGNAVVNVEYYSLHKEVFSRNTGILEPTQMAKKQAVISGLGSGGFFVGLELVKAGIGSIIAADDDIFAYHNICRHVCGIHDVGRPKVDIFKERVADINPNCKVYTFRDLIQHIDPLALEEIVWKDSIILCCTDNRHAGYICNELADKFHIPMVDAGCGARASTGEVFFYKPDSDMACYTCAYGEDSGVDHSNQNVRRKFYATEAELEKLHFQPGMSLDIELTAIFETKLAIDLLMENEDGYVPKLLPYINQCTVLLNYPVDKEINPYVQLFETDGQKPRPLTWKSGRAEINQKCSYCNGES